MFFYSNLYIFLQTSHQVNYININKHIYKKGASMESLWSTLFIQYKYIAFKYVNHIWDCLGLTAFFPRWPIRPLNPLLAMGNYSSPDILITIFNKQKLQNITSQSSVDPFWCYLYHNSQDSLYFPIRKLYTTCMIRPVVEN